MVKEIKVLQICGFSNSGKTTLVNKILSKFAQEGKKVFTIKHHGHGGKPSINIEKDSSQHIKNGAIGSLVEGDGRVILQLEDVKKSLEQQIELAAYFNPDIILVEGHKREDYPKIVLIRDIEDLELIHMLTNIQLVILWKKELRDLLDTTIHILNLEEEKELLDTISEIVN